MGHVLVAIDPGKSTGIAIFSDRELVHVIACDGDAPPTRGEVDEIVCEIPHTGEGRATKGDIIKLAVRAGMAIGSFRCVGAPTLRLVTPNDWKGNLPKAVSHKRIRAKLTEAEIALLRGLPHDSWDAVGIGLWALGQVTCYGRHMAFTVAIAQPTGVGSAVGIKGLSGAWVDEPVIVTLPADQHEYETTIVDQSDGCGAILSGGTTAAPSLTATGKGSVRLLITYRPTSVAARFERGYRVVRFNRNADGTNYTNVAPALNESPAETAEARGYASIMDLVVAGVNAAGLALPEAGFTGLVSLLGSSRAIFSDTGTVCVVGLDNTTSFLPGAQYELLIPAGEATDLEYGANLDPEGAWDPFDAGADYLIAVTAISEDRLVSSGKALVEPTFATPTIVSAEVSALDLDKLALTFSAGVSLPRRVDRWSLTRRDDGDSAHDRERLLRQRNDRDHARPRRRLAGHRYPHVRDREHARTPRTERTQARGGLDGDHIYER